MGAFLKKVLRIGIAAVALLVGLVAFLPGIPGGIPLTILGLSLLSAEIPLVRRCCVRLGACAERKYPRLYRYWCVGYDCYMKVLQQMKECMIEWWYTIRKGR